MFDVKNAIKENAPIELHGLTALFSPLSNHTSGARLGMAAHHAAQAPSVFKPDISRIMHGFESQLQAFDIRMPVNGRIISVHNKYNRTFDSHTIKENPCITIIFQCQETGIYDFLDITNFNNKHIIYGSKYRLDPIVNTLRPGIYLAKDTILAHNHCIQEGNIFANSVSANVVNLSVPGVIEDGIVASKSFCERAALLEISSVVGSWGRKYYAKNLYGDINNYKPFPDIGDKIRPDGLVFAFGEYSGEYDVLKMSNKSLMYIDITHDRLIYGIANAVVHDITVESGIGENKAKAMTSPEMAVQPEKYINHLHTYYDSILASFCEIERQNKKYVLTHALNNLIVRAYADRPNRYKKQNDKTGIIKRQYKYIPLDEYRVVVHFNKKHTLGRGSKLTGRYGNKGVICAIVDDKDMPTDTAGNVGDLAVFFKSGVARTCPSQEIEGAIGGASRDLTLQFKQIANDFPNSYTEIIWEKVMEYYSLVSPLKYDLLKKHYTTFELKRSHVESILESGIYVTIPANSTHITLDTLKRMRNLVNPTYGPVKYKNQIGDFVWTKENCLIGVRDIIVLEKTDMHPMSIDSPLLQHHGLIASSSKYNVTANPSKEQAVVIYSETEIRLVICNVKADSVAMTMELSNSPMAHKALVRIILNAEKPSNLGPLTNIPTDLSRPKMFVKDILYGYGSIIMSM